METIRLAFLVEGETHYDPGVKPFVGFLRGSRGSDVDILTIALNCGPDALSELSSSAEKRPLVKCRTEREAFESIQKWGPALLITDDSPRRLRLAVAAKARFKQKVGIFLHIFSGLHALRRISDNELSSASMRSKYLVSRFIPFSAGTLFYRQQLESADLIVANSEFSSLLCNVLYGVPVSGVVYPPLDPEVFVPSHSVSAGSGSILVFSGGVGEKHSIDYLSVLEKLASRGRSVKLFGSERVLAGARKALGRDVTIIDGRLSDVELAKLYQSVEVTYTPQEWESFGNVGPESLLCGTPVVTNIRHPWIEMVGGSSAVSVSPGEAGTLDSLLHPPHLDLETVRAVRRSISDASSPGVAFGRLVHAAKPFLP